MHGMGQQIHVNIDKFMALATLLNPFWSQVA
jgi:hypothetical protein